MTLSEKDTKILTFKISTGIADKCSIGVKYNNKTHELIKAKDHLSSADGIVLLERIMEFEPNEDRWKTIKIQTPDFINAGQYRVTVSDTSAAPLNIDYNEIQ